MTASVDHVKVRSEHQERLVFIDVRQSSARQVRNHLESQRLQYEFAEQAIAMGWARERIIVLDEDQGRCAALPNARGGFDGGHRRSRRGRHRHEFRAVAAVAQ